METAVVLEKRPKPETPAENLDNQKRILRTGLLGHLQRARDALVKEREKESVCYAVAIVMFLQTIKHMEKEQIVASKLEKMEQERLKTISDEFRSQLNSSEERLRTVESTLTEKNNAIMVSSVQLKIIWIQKIQLTRHYEYMGNFIATKTQPTIFWVPRNFNADLETLRGATKHFITQKVAAIASSDYFSTDINIE
ncbi:hypothetical protein X943_002298 [Babesia divergens]|uniref:Pinin/SDK/MemA protein domain-containing protein n=1 Tax=Babesia divergens TaxID=32595 RepID=A0AAD9LK69_BABDI|nr:hypothetical protein X943_002298 [Babesia divergens]